MAVRDDLMNKDLIEFRNLVLIMLQNMGYSVQPEATLYKNTKIDILAVKQDERQAIELAFSAGKEFDAITRLARLASWPDIDTAYVAMPEAHKNDDANYFAQNLGVGVILVTGEKIVYAVPAARFRANMSLGMSVPTEVKSNSTFDFSLTIGNNGQKVLADVEAVYIPSFPFASPEGEPVSRKIDEIQRGNTYSATFKVQVNPDAARDEYPLLFKVTGLGLTPYRGVLRIKVS
jgi:hypothetical protein